MVHQENHCLVRRVNLFETYCSGMPALSCKSSLKFVIIGDLLCSGTLSSAFTPFHCFAFEAVTISRKSKKSSYLPSFQNINNNAEEPRSANKRHVPGQRQWKMAKLAIARQSMTIIIGATPTTDVIAGCAKADVRDKLRLDRNDRNEWTQLCRAPILCADTSSAGSRGDGPRTIHLA